VDRLIGGSPRFDELRKEWMREPDEVAAMLRLRGLGWGVRRIAAEFECSHVTVRRYLAAGGWTGYRTPRRAKALDGLEDWLAERFRQHRGNADVVRQDLAREKGIVVSLRTVERAVTPRHEGWSERRPAGAPDGCEPDRSETSQSRSDAIASALCELEL
jgi:transposase